MQRSNNPSSIDNNSNTNSKILDGVKVLGIINTRDQAEILNPSALEFVVKLHRAFNPTRKHLLNLRKQREQLILSNQQVPNFLESTKKIREDPTWKGPKLGPGLVDRRVEITGPTDRKMVINALNSGSSCFMADFEDSNSPTWLNSIDGQVNMRDAINRNISLTTKEGKNYSLRNDAKLATLLVRPRGWHLEEAHLQIDGENCSASIFDFGIYFYHNAWNSLKIGQGPYFYLPKMESHLEARLWNDIFNTAQDIIGMPRGTIRATVLIETILAVFEMEEIIYELRDHSAGLNCGRWDYIFSFIKKFRTNKDYNLPDRKDVTMTSPFMDSYVRLLIQTCHKRQVHAMGGMAAQIPIKDNKQANEEAMKKVENDKLREVKAGHDGTWVAHPALIPIALKVFNEYMPYPNQLFTKRQSTNERPVTAQDLINPRIEGAQITEEGIRSNVIVALKYMESWLRGVGCVPINNLMEDAATAEISRTQLWFWSRHQCTTSDGKTITKQYNLNILEEEAEKIRQQLGNDGYSKSKYELAKKHLATQITGEDNLYADFLTTLLYPDIATVTVNSNGQSNNNYSQQANL